MQATDHFVEEAAVLVGVGKGRLVLAGLKQATRGAFASVQADAIWTMNREEAEGDVVGFIHSHPPGSTANPSPTDQMTMQTWCDAFGKPLACVIVCGRELRGHMFYPDNIWSTLMPRVQWAGPGILVLVTP